MILQRLAISIRKQDWFTVLIETLIVVLGVFLGIQLGNWNEARVTKERQQVLLEELVEDLRADLVQLEGVEAFNQLRFSAAEGLVARATGWRLADTYPQDWETDAPLAKPDGVLPETATASDVLYFAQRFAAFDMQQRTYAAALATGDLAFAGRPGLSADIRAHYAGAEEYIATETTLYRDSHADLTRAFARHGLSVSEDISWEDLLAIVESDPELIGQLKIIIWQTAVQHYYLDYLQAETLDLIETIEAGKD